MKITILSKTELEVDINNKLVNKPVLNDDSDIVIVYSDDYFDDILFDHLLKLKKKYLAVFVTSFNSEELMLYNKQYLEFCFNNNINFLDYDKQIHNLNNYINDNIIISPNYTKFNYYYQTMQAELNYAEWFNGKTFEGKKILDLGCGVPHYLEGLNPREYVGVDLSETMTTSAKEKFPYHTFLTANILETNINADVVISILDVLNYIPEFEQVKTVIENVYNNLSDGGQFIFDIHDKSVLRSFKDYFDFEEIDDEQFIWESNVKNHDLTHYFQIIDKDYKVHVEKHYQHYYDIKLIIKHLKSVGFKKIQINDCYNHHIITAYKENNE